MDEKTAFENVSVKGQVIGGELGKVLIRQKSGQKIELGELLICDGDDIKVLLQVYDLVYGSQISQQNLELISGMKLEDDVDVSFFDVQVRNYTLAYSKPILQIGKTPRLCKGLPLFFNTVRDVREDDLTFLSEPKKPVYLGNLRSGSKALPVPISLELEDVFSHHMLISATTGRGKSNLVKVMLKSVVSSEHVGIVVLDPHDEYYGRDGIGTKDISYYTLRSPPPGTRTLKINLRLIKPGHFKGAVNFSDAQVQLMNAYYKEYGTRWVESVIIEKPLKVNFHDQTVSVLRRRLLQILDIHFDGEQMNCRGVFDISAGETTINDIVRDVEMAKTVVIDTSAFAGSVEIIIGSMIASSLLSRYKKFKQSGVLDTKPVVSIVLEEAPRVLGKAVLESGPNVFSTIAREGRKFKIGLLAITQLPSLIPREILANMNTKIILGIEMKPERQALIESASQDISQDDRNIASLDRGEAIVTSNFSRFAIPIKIPLYSEYAKNLDQEDEDLSVSSFEGINLD